MDYGGRIKDLLNDNDINQKDFAVELNISRDILNNYVNRRTTIPPDIIAKIATYFSITADYLVGLTDDPLPPFHVSAGERAMLERFRTLTGAQKELILQNIELMNRQNQRG